MHSPTCPRAVRMTGLRFSLTRSSLISTYPSRPRRISRPEAREARLIGLVDARASPHIVGETEGAARGHVQAASSTPAALQPATGPADEEHVIDATGAAIRTVRSIHVRPDVGVLRAIG